MRASATGACLRRPPSLCGVAHQVGCAAPVTLTGSGGECWTVGHVVFVCDVCAICRPLSLTGAAQPWCVVSLSLTEWRAGACPFVLGDLCAAVPVVARAPK